ncbi:MAG: DNA mismatch repair protein [Halobacteriales archaeon]|nr:DNA mismatch repair protein [Halobacteriales archaeon]
MRLQEYWGVGPKTAAQLVDALGEPAAVAAIESADVRALTEAGLSRGRATAILRRAEGGEAMGVLATRDARSVYKSLLDLASEYAVTAHAADRINVLTPLGSREAIEARLDAVEAAIASWEALDDETERAVLEAFAGYDSQAGDRAAVQAALELRETGVEGGVFEPLADLDPDALEEAAASLGQLAGGDVVAGADDELDRLRANLEEVERLEGSAFDVLDEIRERGVRGGDEFEQAVLQYLNRETEIDLDTIRRAAPDDAADAADFVGATLRSLAADLRETVEEREATVADQLADALEDAEGAVADAVEAVDHVTLFVSLARFAIDLDLARPTLREDGDTLAFEGARNLGLATAEGESVQPVDYAVGEHGLDGAPSGEQVAVVTGANSGGKTTLLETCCQVALLAAMGLPVPAERAEVSRFDAVVFHRRHASFNAGVLEATLKSVVPPLTGEGRTLMLVDEFEAITEPGSAASLLHGLVTLTVDQGSLGAFVTHLADDLEPLPDAARTDGIFAEGLDRDLNLVVDYQPRFGTVGRSTPEFIVSRLVADAADPRERLGFEALAEALGAEIVQRTLDDARWDG